MKYLFTLVLMVLMSIGLQAKGIEGLWKTYNEKTGKEQSLVRVYIEDGKLYGEVIELLGDDKGKDLRCKDCPGNLNNKPIVGIEIFIGLERDGKEWKGKNKLFDPETRKFYKCSVYMVNDKKLAVKGMIGPFSETRYWIKAS